MPFRDRIGIDLGRRVPVEDGIKIAAAHDVHFIDVQTDIAPNALESFDETRCAAVREACERSNVHLGLHTLSGVNVAEISPYLRDAADAYLKAYIDLAVRLKAEWIVVHGGYHFTSCKAIRKQASIDRLKRIVDYAEQKDVLLQLENLNSEPELAEVHYMPDTLEDTIWYFDQIQSPNLKWAFTINHAHYDPIGIAGFVDGMGMARCDEIRVADNNGEYELHMHPGTGTVDFVDMFRRIEGAGFNGHYMCGWGTVEQMIEGREYLVERAREAGIAGA
ncbi:MAG: sugar phosphate isomerase/epimerase family protein [Hyphomicrobiaceae bacterium]